MSSYLKVGRLLPGENGIIRIMKDGSGEIGAVARADVILTLAGIETFPVSPSGEMDLSNPRKAVKFVVNGVFYLAIADQVRRMDNEWPKKKAALWGVVK